MPEGTIYTCPMYPEIEQIGPGALDLRHSAGAQGRPSGRRGPEPELVDFRRRVLPAAGWDAAEVLRLAASLERGSEHPLAEAIVRGVRARGIALASAEDFQAVTGKGVRGRVDGRPVALGNAAMLAELGIAGARSAEADRRRDAARR